jgi:alanine-glyoxylate transaminase/serine-glyoxylate transaminase/serine-pyruvate transaminase
MIFEEGLDNVWWRHEILARSVWAAVDAWHTDGGLCCNISDPTARSHAVTTISTGTVDATELRRICEHDMGLTLGLGIGAADAPRFRIGHMGHLNPPMLLGTLGTIEAALHAIGAPIGGSGVAAAARLIGDAISPA